MTGAPPDDPAPSESAGELPGAVRVRVVALAEETLAALPEDEVPASLRAVRKFTPSKRARLGAAALGAALDTEPEFRRAVADRVRAGLPAVAQAVDTGAGAAAVDAADLAAVAYVLAAPDWPARVAAVATPPPGRVSEEPDPARRSEQDERELRRLRRDLAAARLEADDLRRRLARSERAAQRADRSAAEALGRAQEAAADRDATERRLSAEVRRLRQQRSDAEQVAAAARRGVRDDRDAATARLRVLLETITTASAGLRRELDLPAAPVRPGDLVGAAAEREAPTTPELVTALRRGRRSDDPAVVDDLLAVPGLHLVVDGYNVTKLGYPALSLEDQRNRLVNALGGLVARSSGVELTCVFDGTAATARPVGGAVPRGVRVLFSAPSELADELIARLVEAEPPGRPVVVVTNDREVVRTVRGSGADALASGALLGRLDRQ